MKKVVFLFYLLAVITIMSACSGDSSTQGEVKENNSPEVTETEETEKADNDNSFVVTEDFESSNEIQTTVQEYLDQLYIGMDLEDWRRMSQENDGVFLTNNHIGDELYAHVTKLADGYVVSVMSDTVDEIFEFKTLEEVKEFEKERIAASRAKDNKVFAREDKHHKHFGELDRLHNRTKNPFAMYLIEHLKWTKRCPY